MDRERDVEGKNKNSIDSCGIKAKRKSNKEKTQYTYKAFNVCLQKKKKKIF